MYHITKEEYRILLDNVDRKKLNIDYGDPQSPCFYIKYFSKETGELRLSEIWYYEDVTYTIHSEFLPEETKEPTPRIHIKVDTWKDLQAVVDLVLKARKAEENGSEG